MRLNGTRWVCVLLLAASSMGMGAGMMGGGCDNCADVTGLDGVWTIQRGDIEVKVVFTTSANGGQEQTVTKTTLEPLDPAEFPTELADFVAKWNENLAAVNTALDAALPDTVIVTFPQCAVMRLTDPNDATKMANGIIGELLNYAFLTELLGGGQAGENGGGALALQAAAVQGNFDANALTTSGQIIRSIAILIGDGASNGLAFGVSVSVNYSGDRTGDVQ